MDQGVSVPSISAADLAAAAATNLDIMRAELPPAATSAPPAVAIASDKGTATSYARADHTHKSSVQRARVSVPLTTGGKAVVNFPSGTYTDAPVVVASAETPAGVTDGFYVASIIDGLTTASKFEVQVFKAVKSITLPSLATSLLGLVLNLTVAATGTVTVDYISAPATS